MTNDTASASAPPVTVAEFLTARLDEAEAEWHRSRKVKDIYGLPCPVCGEGVTNFGSPHDAGAMRVGHNDSIFDGHDLTAEEWQAFGDDGPAGDPRVLADIAAKRAILAAHQRHEERIAFALALDLSPAHPDQRRDATWEILRLLATAYSDHPDYRQEWKS